MKDKKYYVGMDVHKATAVIAVLNSEGKQKMQAIVETNASSLYHAAYPPIDILLIEHIRRRLLLLGHLLLVCLRKEAISRMIF